MIGIQDKEQSPNEEHMFVLSTISRLFVLWNGLSSKRLRIICLCLSKISRICSTHFHHPNNFHRTTHFHRTTLSSSHNLLAHTLSSSHRFPLHYTISSPHKLAHFTQLALLPPVPFPTCTSPNTSYTQHSLPQNPILLSHISLLTYFSLLLPSSKVDYLTNSFTCTSSEHSIPSWILLYICVL